jgi:hypothetical protein
MIAIFFALIPTILAQVNLTTYLNYPTYYNSSRYLTEVKISDNGNTISFSFLDDTYPNAWIQTLNVADPNNVYIVLVNYF